MRLGRLGPTHVFDQRIYHRGRRGSRCNVDGIEFAFNSAGFRDVARSRVKPDGVIRVALIGDSYVEGWECDFSGTVGPTLQRLVDADESIAACLRRFGVGAVEVIPFGLKGFAPTHYWRLFEHEVLQYEPDLVYVNVFSFNDISGMVPFRERVPGGGYRTPFGDYYRLHDGELVLERSMIDEYRVYMRAQHAQWFRDAATARMRRIPVLRALHERVSQASDGSPSDPWTEGYSWTLWKGLFAYAAAEPETRRAYEIAVAILARMRDLAEQRGSRLFTVHLANADALDSELLAAEIESWQEFDRGQEVREYDFSEVDPWLPSAELKADLDLNRAWQGADWRDLFGFRGLKWGHYTPAGNRRWAEDLLGHLRSVLPEHLSDGALGGRYSKDYDPFAYPLY